LDEVKPEHKALFGKLTDGDLLGLLLYLEGRGEPIDGRIAIGSSVRNRVNASESKSYFAIITAPNQFSCLNSNDPNYSIGVKLAESFADNKMPEDLTRKLQECRWIAFGIVNGSILDNTKGANHYYNPKVCNPSWAKDMAITVRIGNHIFLKEG
jgi:N-acetylmuramoyl-L-alanine amidase